MEMHEEHREEDVAKESVEHSIEYRVPWLLLGLLGGAVATVIVSKYEAVLAADVRLAFFIPIIVYLSDAVGTQTETIYVRSLSKKKVNFIRYIAKESVIGFGLGIVSGIVFGMFATYWLASPLLGITIGLAMLVNLTIAPVLAVLIPNMLYKQHVDPALGAGPVATIIQDVISLLVYFMIASIIIL